MMSFFKAVLAVLIVGTVVRSVDAQNPPPGLPLDSLQMPVPLGSIEPLSNNVHLEIPIGSIPQRGDNAMIMKLVYDTQYVFFFGGYFGFGPGWRVVFGPEKQLSITSTTYNSPCPHPAYPDGGAYTTGNYAAIDASGTYHYADSGLYVYHIVCQDSGGHPDPDTGGWPGAASSKYIQIFSLN